MSCPVCRAQAIATRVLMDELALARAEIERLKAPAALTRADLDREDEERRWERREHADERGRDYDRLGAEE